LDGFVTRVTSPLDFEVNGVKVLLSKATEAHLQTGNTKSYIATSDIRPYVGEAAQIFGRLHKKAHTVDATDIRLRQAEPHEVSGSGIVDSILPSPGDAHAPDDHLVRADGYSVLVSAKTTVVFTPSLSADTAFRANVWITFHGTQRPDGVVVAAKAAFSENVISGGEDKLRASREYDPAAVDPAAKQSGLSKAFLGVNPKLIPPYKDDAMQARISMIGARLVPQYQRDLPDSDQTKINFRFQLIDTTRWRDALALPNGIILVPRQVVQRMQNDSQLATVLADNIVCVLEKQYLHMLPSAHKMTAAQVAGSAGGIFVPGLGIATLGGNMVVSSRLLHAFEQQSGRVSLGLLRDAGYDIYEAPRAWWLLAPVTPTDTANTPLPRRAAYLYQMLGENWRVQ